MPEDATKPKDKKPDTINPHDEVTAQLHAAAKELGVTPAWLAQQPEWASRLAKKETK